MILSIPVIELRWKLSALYDLKTAKQTVYSTFKDKQQPEPRINSFCALDAFVREALSLRFVVFAPIDRH